MRLSTKGRYGVRLMIDLAVHYGQGPMDLKDIARRQAISEKYLGHLIPLLKNAGLLNSVRGARGGYLLAKPPGLITLKDIVCTLEGSMNLVDCVSDPAACKRSRTCVSRDIWADLTAKILDTLKSFTLETMADKYRKKQDIVTYSI